MKNLVDKVLFITGAAGGIGFALAHAFGKAGMRVAITDIDAQRLENAAQTLRENGITVFATPLDVANYDDWQRVANAAETALGPVAILCNNAGIGIGTALHLDDPARWRTVLEVNALGPFYGCRTFVPRMLASGNESHIVNIASLSGLRSNAGTSSYNASKHAVVGMTDAMREELIGTTIGLSLVYPGVVRTGFVANSRQTITARTGTELDESLAKQTRQIEAIQKLGMNPDKIAERVVAAVLAGEYHVFTHCDHKALLAALYEERLNAIGENADPDYHEDLMALQQAFDSAKESA